MTQPEQPGNWSDPTWQAPPAAPPYSGPNTAHYPPTAYQAPEVTSAPPVSGPSGGYAAPAYGYPGYPGYGYGPPAAQTTNGLAIASLVCSLAGLLTCGVSALVGAILGHVAKRQIRDRGEGGGGLATAGVISGWIIFGLHVVVIIGYVVTIVWVVQNSPELLEPTPEID